jgi:hypothetical protein
LYPFFHAKTIKAVMMTAKGIATPMPILAPVERPELEPEELLLFGDVELLVGLLPAPELLLLDGDDDDDDDDDVLVVPVPRHLNAPWITPDDASFWNPEQSIVLVLSRLKPPLTIASDGKFGLW